MADIQYILDGLSHQESVVSDRRRLLYHTARAAMLTLLPISMAAQQGPSPPERVADAMNVLIRLAHMLSDFYKQGLETKGLIPEGPHREALKTIYKHKQVHTAIMWHVIKAQFGIPNPTDSYDFTGGNGSAGGPYPDVLNSSIAFFELAQVMEDVAIRAFKAQTGNLIQDNDAIEVAHRIHTTCGRHAAKIRMIRKEQGADIKPWITMKQSGITNHTASSMYEGEQNTKQETFGGLVDIRALNGNTTISLEVASEAFDEPVYEKETLEFVNLFTLR